MRFCPNPNSRIFKNIDDPCIVPPYCPNIAKTFKASVFIKTYY